MIGALIKHLLVENEDLTNLVGSGKIFPYIINKDTTLPTIVYMIEGVDPEYSKDGWVLDKVRFSVSAFSNDYAELQKILLQIRESLELKSGTIQSIIIRPIYMTGLTEGFNITEDTFMLKIDFNVEVIGWDL